MTFNNPLPWSPAQDSRCTSRCPVGRDSVVCAEVFGAWLECPWPGAAGKGAQGLVNVINATSLLTQKREGYCNLGDNLDEELAKGIVCDIASSGGVVVTTPEAVKEAESVDEST